MAAPLCAQSTAPVTGPKIWLQQNRPLAVQPVGNPGATQMLAAGWAEPLTLANADFDADGVNDLVVGYAAPRGGILAIHRGNLDAFAPQSQASFDAIGRGEFPEPFLPNALALAIPVRPDFVVVGSYNGEGYPDIIVAQRGDSSVYLLGNDGHGNFSSPRAIDVGGPITALAAGNFGGSGTYTKLLVGISSSRGSYLMVYEGTLFGLGGVTVRPLPGPATSIQFGDFGDPGLDAAILAGGHIQILRSSNLRLVSVALPGSYQAFALGSFIFDRNNGAQFALLASDGSLQIAARNEFDPRIYTTDEARAIRSARRNHQPDPAFVPTYSFPSNGWRIVESFSGVGSVGAGQSATMFRTRISVNGPDDVMLLNASGSLVLISHANAAPGSPTFAPGQVSVRSYAGSPIAALPMRVNVDGRLGVVALHRNEVAPSLSMPIPDPTFFVNTDNDPTPTSPIANACTNTSASDLSASCSLREAVLKANGDTIMLQAGHTYSLTIGRGATQDYTGNTGALYVNHTATIVGGNQNTTIIQWGTPGSGNVDMVMAVNEDIAFLSTASASLSNLTIQGGSNSGTHGNDGDGGCMEFDTGTNGTSTLSLTNVTIQNCATTQGGGGGLVTFAFVKPSGGGTVSIANSIFQNNTAVDSVAGTEGGGVAFSAGSIVTMTNSQVMNNTSNHVVSGQAGLGGGIALDASGGTPGSFGSVTIHSSTISGNTAGGLGGGISDLGMSLTIDAGTVISGNSGGVANKVNEMDGGGIYLNTHTTDTVSLSKVTITGNSATGNGGAIHTGNASAFPSAGPTTISLSRMAGNTAGGSGSNLRNSGTTVTATNNWWGTDAASSTISTVNSGATTFDPFIVLTHSASPSKIRINQSSTLTADMSKDNHANGVTLSGNLDEIGGLPVTFDSPVLGTIPQAQPETLNGTTAVATATFNAGGTAGIASANATVDQQVVPVNTNAIASASESGTTVTITTVGAHNFAAGNQVTISGVGVSGYNGTFTITGVTPATQFTYTANSSGLSSSSGGTASIGLVILQPPSITKSFSPHQIQSTGFNASAVSTITFSIDNSANPVPINASFTDNLPSGLLVASSPASTNTCGGTLTATAGSGSISFSNSSLAVGTCTITVPVSSAADANYSNSITINSTDAGNGNTSSDTLAVVNPPHISKSFGVASIPYGGTTSLTITVANSNNANTTLSAITFTDTLPNNTPGTVIVATPNGLSKTCSGTATATAGSGTVSLGSSSLAAGATCTVSVNVQGTGVGAANNSVSASDTAGGTGNTANASLTVNAANTSTALASSVNPSVYGQSVTLTATVTNTDSGVVPTGSVEIFDGLVDLGAASFNSNPDSVTSVYKFTTSTLANGTHSLKAVFTDTAGNFVSSNGTTSQVVNAASTSTGLAASANPSLYGQSVTFTATVTNTATGAAPTGSVEIFDGLTDLGAAAFNSHPGPNSSAYTFTTAALAGGTHSLKAVFTDVAGNFIGSNGTLSQVVNKTNTTTTVTSSVNPSIVGQSVTFTATVTPTVGSGVPTGNVGFLNNGVGMGAGTLSGGVATFTTSVFGIGNHTITTTYNGNANFNGSSGSLTGNPQVVNGQAATMTTPIPGSTLTTTSVTFNWSTGAGVTKYWLWIGTTPGSLNLYDVDQGTNHSVTVNGLSLNGRPIYVRLLSFINGAWQFNDYTYTMGTDPAQMKTPTPGSTLTNSSTMFTWSTGTAVTEYWLWIGTSPGTLNLYDANQGLNTSVTVNNLPLNGKPVYVRLFSFINGAWQFNDYTYTMGTDPAQMQTPIPGSTLSTATATFNWGTGTNVTEYWLWIGTSPGSLNLYDANQFTNTSVTVHILPANGSTVYVRLFSYINGAWQFKDYSYVSGP